MIILRVLFAYSSDLASERMELLQSNIKDWLFLALVTYVLKVSIGKKPVLNYT